jgi:hypothetical protein
MLIQDCIQLCNFQQLSAEVSLQISSNVTGITGGASSYGDYISAHTEQAECEINEILKHDLP